MRCYNCGCELSEHHYCTNCGVEVDLFKKIIRTSNYFYNQGLERARVRDLSGAIVSLRQSLRFNKNNIKARNLLGLVYFEMGEVPAALSEWVISKNLRSKKNLAAEYLELVQSNANRLETINKSIKDYNSALENLKDPNGLDMAVISLKHSLRANGNFLRAHQLLALCYIKNRNLQKAKAELEKSKAIDVNNTQTLRYIAEVERLLEPQDSKKKNKNAEDDKSAEPIRYPNDVGMEIIVPPPARDRRGSSTVLNIIFGIAIGFAITFFLVLPARVQQERAAAQADIKSIGTQLDAKNIAITELESEISSQNDKIATLTESLNAYAGTEGTLLSMENLLKAASIYLDNPEDYLSVADYIRDVDETSWTDDTSENYKNLYNALKTAIGPNVCLAYYDEGLRAHKASQYEDAIAYLEAAVFFDITNKDALYQLAVSYEASDRIEDAKTAYGRVIELFPDTWHSSKAQTALDKLAQ